MEKIFSFTSYKTYIRRRAGKEGTKKGIKASLARALRCQPTYISQILHGKAQLSLEQAEMANQFFAHTKEESLFFLLLVQKERAGTASLAKHFQDQLAEILNRRLILTSRLGAKKALDPQDQSIYYSSWIYAAAHIALTIPELRTREALAKYFCLPLKKITETLEFLTSAGLAVEENGTYAAGTSQIRLGKDSHNIIKHHTNWRTQAIESLEREELPDLHYSGVVSLSSRDILEVKNQLLEKIDEIQKTVRDSKEEELCAIGIDFFRIKR